MTKEELLKQVFETCSFEEITKFGIENNQIENVDILTLAETIEKEGFKVNIFSSDDYCDAISHLLDEASLKCTLPTSYDLMGVIKNHYFISYRIRNYTPIRIHPYFAIIFFKFTSCIYCLVFTRYW